MEMMTGQEPQVQAEPRKAPLWEDVVDVFVSPAALFRRNAQGSWVAPWLTVSIVSVILYYVFLPATRAISQAAMQAAMAKQHITEMPAAAQSFADKMQLVGGIFIPIFMLVMIALVALAIWALGAMAKGGPSYKQAALIVAWASFVGIVQQVLMDVLILLKVNNGQDISATKDVSFGLVRFLDVSTLPDALVPWLGRIDIFAIWAALLWLIGLKVICRWSTGKATLVAVLTWLVYAVPGSIWALVKPGG